MTATVVVALACAAGLCSALVPLINAEAYALTSAGTLSNGMELVLVVLALSVGQTAGKVVLFETARHGTGWWAERVTARRGRSGEPKWGRRVSRCLSSPRLGPTVVIASASLGVPPLALTSIASGAAGQRRRIFVPLCLIGRTARFLALVIPAAALLR